MRHFIGICFLIAASPAAAAQGCDDALVYRQDIEGATGWNQMLPVAPADAAIAEFTDWPFLDLTINGETTRYTTTSGGTGIRSRAAYIPDEDGAKTFGYTIFDIGHRVAEGQPDAATQAWWELVATPIPRDVENEIAVLVARAPVMPPPNSLLSEDRDYLVRLNRALATLYAAELRNDQLPTPVRNLMANLSAELFRRRVHAGPAE